MMICVASGCRKPSTPSDYTVLAGTVESLRAETTCELTVRPGRRWSGHIKTATISCLLTNDAEIYVNDRFSSFAAIAIGDEVELIGYRESNPRGERFVVAFAYITRNEPLPGPPDLSPPTTNPTTQPQES